MQVPEKLYKRLVGLSGYPSLPKGCQPPTEPSVRFVQSTNAGMVIAVYRHPMPPVSGQATGCRCGGGLMVGSVLSAWPSHRPPFPPPTPSVYTGGPPKNFPHLFQRETTMRLTGDRNSLKGEADGV
jgi:hypothetical protein